MYSRRSFITLSAALGIAPVVFASTSPLSSALVVEDKTDLEKIKLLLSNEQPVIWLFTGDSITQGAKHTAGYRSFPEIFAERIRWEMPRRRDVVINTGISGAVTKDLLADFEWRVSQFRPAVVSVMIGTNDAAYPAISTNDFRKNLELLINRIRDAGAVPVLHTPNYIQEDPQRLRLPEFIPVITETAETKKLILVDNWSAWKADPEYAVLLDDAIHPGSKGHSQIAKLLFKALDIFDANAATCQ